jgi:non-specific serine/threonine protein kinase
MGFLYVQYFNCGVKKDPAIFKEAEKYVNKAFELYPEVFLGHYALGFALYLQGNVKSAIKHIKRAIEIEPTNSDAMRMLCYQYSILLGKPEKAIQLARRVIALDPLTPINYLAPALIHWAHGNFKNAKEECKKYHQMAPDNIHAQCWYSILLIWSGELEEAYAIIEKTKNDYPGETMTKLMLFLGYANRNEIDKVNSTLSEDFLIYAWNDHFYTWFFADGFSLLDKKDESIKWLKRTIELGFINYPFIAEIDPFLKNIRGEVLFQRLLKKVKSEWENFNA